MENIEVEGTILNMREHENFKKKHFRAVLEDETGRIGLDLWRGQTSQVKNGDRVIVRNGFVRYRHNGRMLNTWDETIEILKRAAGLPDKKSTTTPSL